jgi:two-component system nitrate/nitrite response regulator NarP
VVVPSRRVLLVDENDDFLDGLASLMAKQPGLEVVGRAHLGHEAVERARSLSPDLILMDVSLRDMSGFEAVDLIKAHPRAPKVLLMTFHESRAAVTAALASGADGCLSKSGTTEQLLRVIERLVGPTGE